MSIDVVESLRNALGDRQVVSTPEDLSPYLVDWRGQWHGTALAAVLPETVQDVSTAMRVCTQAGVAVVPHGGNTSMSGGAIPLDQGRSVVVSVAKMKQIRSLDTVAATMTVEAGCTLSAVRDAAEDAGKLFPLSIGSEGSCHVGGSISTNAGGTGVLRYGNTRDLVLGLEVVLPDGEIWNGLRSLRKDNSGYDLKQLFIGAEGTLGIVTAAVLKLFPQPKDVAMAWVAVRNVPEALELLARTQDRFDTRLTAFELLSWTQIETVLRGLTGSVNPLADAHPWNILIELSDPLPEAELKQHLTQHLVDMLDSDKIVDATVAESDRQANALWQLRHSISDVNKADGTGVTLDVSVPLTEVPGFIEDADKVVAGSFQDAKVFVVSHLGDGNVHYVVHYPHPRWQQLEDPDSTRQAIFDQIPAVAMSHEGSFSAELGIGIKLVDEVGRYKSPIELKLLRTVKDALDPHGRMNPGKLLPNTDRQPSQ